jgi:hypothetical protein
LSGEFVLERPFAFEWNRNICLGKANNDLSAVIIRDIYPKCRLTLNGNIISNTNQSSIADGLLYNKSMITDLARSKFYILIYNVNSAQSFAVAERMIDLILYIKRQFESSQQQQQQNYIPSSLASLEEHEGLVIYDSHTMKYEPYVHNPIFLIGIAGIPGQRQVSYKQGASLALLKGISFFECGYKNYDQIEKIMNEAFQELYRMEFMDLDSDYYYYGDDSGNSRTLPTISITNHGNNSNNNNNDSAGISGTGNSGVNTFNNGTNGIATTGGNATSITGNNNVTMTHNNTMGSEMSGYHHHHHYSNNNNSSSRYDGKKLTLDELLSLPKLYI